jgi:hypothetical protein
MEDALATYLKDHMAGAQFAMNLMQRLSEAYAAEPLGDFATELLEQVESDFEVLKVIAGRFDAAANPLKEAAAWLAEKVSQPKLQFTREDPLGTFETLEFLTLGVLGKLKLWQVLSALAPSRPELQNIDFAELTLKAQTQHDALERWRRDVALTAFIN